MRKLISVAMAIALAGSLALAASASAVPSFVGSLNPQPQGKLYKEVAKPVNLNIDVKITPAPGDATLLPQIQTQIQFPDGMDFYPDPKMPVCEREDSSTGKVGPGYLPESLPPAAAIGLCPNSIVGEGRADLYLSQIVSPATFITDPIMTVFNNGTDKNGKGRILVSAYSASTGAGILIGGSIDAKGLLKIDIPRLTADSSVPAYQLAIPGTTGQDSKFVRSICKTGTWTDQEGVLLGKRNTQGTISDELQLNGAVNATACEGLRGKARLANVKVKGPKKVKANRKAKFKVTVKNRGTASARNVKLVAKGAGKGKKKVGKLIPGAKKTVRIKVKVKGKKGAKVAVKIKAKGKKTNAAVGKKKVRLK